MAKHIIWMCLNQLVLYNGLIHCLDRSILYTTTNHTSSMYFVVKCVLTLSLILCYVMQTNDWSMWQNNFWRIIITQSHCKATFCLASSSTVSYSFSNRKQVWCHDLRIVRRGLSISWNHLSLTNKRTGTIILVNDTFRGGKRSASRSEVTDCPLLPHFSRFIYKRSTNTENRADRPPTRLKIHICAHRKKHTKSMQMSYMFSYLKMIFYKQESVESLINMC